MSQPKVAIVGLGLIGSSMGLALRKAQPEFQIVGHDKDRSLSRKAHQLGAVEKSERNLVSAVEDAELLIITTAFEEVRKVLETAGPHLRSDCVVTDTSAVKGKIMRWADEFLPETVHFVGGHPMVSPQYGDASAATPDLFTGSTYCLVPSPKAHAAAVELVTGMVLTLGAQPFFLDVDEHDGQVAAVEHLPIMLAAALLLSTSRAPSSRDLRRLPGDTFWRATEFPSTDPEINRGILLSNKEGLSRWIDIYIDSLRALQEQLTAADDGTWEELLTELMDTRAHWRAARGTAGEEGPSRVMGELRGTTSLGSLFGINQFLDFRKRMEDRRQK